MEMSGGEERIEKNEQERIWMEGKDGWRKWDGQGWGPGNGKIIGM
jgi:hypothetical protein